MRIAFLADALDLQSAGVHVYTREIIKALASIDTKHEYIIVRVNRSTEPTSFEEIPIPYINIPGYKAYRIFWQLPRLLAKRKVDVVVEPAHFGPFNLPKHIKRVTFIHDLTPLLFPQYHVFHSQWLQRLFLPSILRRATHVITNSAHTRQDLIQFFPFTANKSTATLLGKDLMYRPIEDAEVLNAYGIQPPYLLCVGTIEPRKNIKVLLAAFDRLKTETNYPFQLVLLGKKGWKSDGIYQRIQASPFREDIHLPGFVEREALPVIYSMAEIFIYPSLYEGFGLPVLEAMSCGVPVLTADVSSLPEVGGEGALYFDPRSVEELLDWLIQLSDSPALRWQQGRLGLERATQFSWEKTARETDAIFDRLARES